MACKYSAAMLKHRVAIQALAREPDGQGGFEEVWGDIAAVWAAVEPLKGWEKMQAMQLASPITHRVVIRHRALTTAQRLVFKGRVLDIKEAINERESNAWLRLMCVEGGTHVANPEWNFLGTPWESWTGLWAPAAADLPAWGASVGPWEDLQSPWDQGIGAGIEALATDWNALNTNWEAIG